MKRLFDIALSLFAAFILFIPFFLIAIMVRLDSKGDAIHFSKRVGQNNKLFLMPKFRTMHIDTPDLATHLISNPERYVTRFGKFLRRTSLDELPQIYSILIGKMSFVGPRPALYNQDDLISARNKKKIHLIKPGLTGWSQINGRDELSISEKVSFDEEYLMRQSFSFDIYIICMTILGTFTQSGISH